ncbi:fatty acid synthase [Aplysia californica]|uniref:Fatty acid synthase n=1 Tax=Aplysia californica TaxID=6500 RepID=A0ABM0ZVU1_APLCA|nr:fatty acid synthase [Aplysia californica]
MRVLQKNINISGILLDSLFDSSNDEWPEVVRLVGEGMTSGVVRPLKTTVFDKMEVEGAFRFMAQGRHIGKVVIRIRNEENEKVAVPPAVSILAVPRATCNPNKSYVITGGLGGFGLELVQWLVERGAKKLVLSSRYSVLHDGLLDNQSSETFRATCEPKVQGTINFDKASRDLCKDSLEWFVAFSSYVATIGNAGQTNYGFANSAVERICEMRKAQGFPALAVQLGAVGDVGVVIETLGPDAIVAGTFPQKVASCLVALERFLTQGHCVVASFVLPEKKSETKDKKGTHVNLVEAVAKILGVTNASTLNPDTCLVDLGLDSLMSVEILQLLLRDFQISLTSREIRSLTMSKIQKMNQPDSGLEGDDKTLARSESRRQSRRVSSSILFSF